MGSTELQDTDLFSSFSENLHSTFFTPTTSSLFLWWRQPIMIPFQSKEALIDEQIRYVQANFQN
ncbi:uncharacterized protein LOC106380897 [Brassica napus]|uniref:uncharacterized protein LOC106380897 n=1 Tax=Brassica napus TaxID=3708 RepID=UPI00207B0DB5|nr:uncharacterized protein LOC106380897 [Brassica napus]